MSWAGAEPLLAAGTQKRGGGAFCTDRRFKWPGTARLCAEDEVVVISTILPFNETLIGKGDFVHLGAGSKIERLKCLSNEVKIVLVTHSDRYRIDGDSSIATENTLTINQ